MATPARLREDVAEVADDAAEALAALLRGVPQPEVPELLSDVLPGLILTYGEVAAVLASEWYDEARTAALVAGSYVASPVDLPDPGTPGLIRWAQQAATSFPAMLQLIEGGYRKRVTNGARLTVADNTSRDPQAEGFQRFASGGCAFCRMLAGRGAVYRTADTADFGAHDNCNCVAVPAFSGRPLPVRPYEPSSRNISDADRARVREWIASH